MVLLPDCRGWANHPAYAYLPAVVCIASPGCDTVGRLSALRTSPYSENQTFGRYVPLFTTQV